MVEQHVAWSRETLLHHRYYTQNIYVYNRNVYNIYDFMQHVAQHHQKVLEAKLPSGSSALLPPKTDWEAYIQWSDIMPVLWWYV